VDTWTKWVRAYNNQQGTVYYTHTQQLNHKEILERKVSGSPYILGCHVVDTETSLESAIDINVCVKNNLFWGAASSA
jgi:hypothetical protein